MVKDSRHCKALVITIIRIVGGGSWKNFYPSAGKLCAMSRCYPYPPPGYEKKAQSELGAQAELGLTHKKEKHKHKDKKKKKKRDSDANGDSHDKDRKSKKSHRTQPANEVFTKNGKIPEVKDVCPPLSLENALQRTDSAQAGSSRSEQNLDGVGHDSASCSRRKEADWRIEGRLPLKVDTPAGSSNGTTAAGTASSSGHIVGSEIDLLKQRIILAVPQTSTEVWSAIDDQEWLFLTDNQLHSKPRGKKLEENNGDGDSQVWDEVKLLPSADIYALPYVVPY